MSDQALYELLHISRESYKRYGITGMFICLPESYILVIEAPEETIEQLYRNIQNDALHIQVTTLREGPIASSIFTEWGWP